MPNPFFEEHFGSYTESMHIPAHSDGESGIIRTLFRRYPDSDSDV